MIEMLLCNNYRKFACGEKTTAHLAVYTNEYRDREHVAWGGFFELLPGQEPEQFGAQLRLLASDGWRHADTGPADSWQWLLANHYFQAVVSGNQVRALTRNGQPVIRGPCHWHQRSANPTNVVPLFG